MILLEGVKSIMVISGYLEDKLNEKRRRDRAKREAEDEKRMAEAVETAVDEAIEIAVTEVRRKPTKHGQTGIGGGWKPMREASLPTKLPQNFL